MGQTYKPQGYSPVSPYFIVQGAQRFIDLLKSIFHVEEARRYDNSDGSIMHAEVRIGDSVIMVGDASEQFPPNRLLVHVYVEDVDATFQRALAAGCAQVEAPKTRADDPDKRGVFTDFSGNTWAVATQQ